MHEKIVNKQRETSFSLNMDEKTSSNLLRVLYNNKITSSVILERLAFYGVPSVDNEHFFSELQALSAQLDLT